MTEMKKLKMNYFRGHQIRLHNGRWEYSDSGELVSKSWKNRPCGHCGKSNTKEGHDGCLSILIGVINACCGHGVESDAYVQFAGGRSVQGKQAHMIQEGR